MTLTGSDMTACDRFFTQSMGKLLGFLQNEIASLDEICDGYRVSEGGNSRGARHRDVYTRFVSAVRNTSLADWVAAFPEATTLKKSVSEDFLNGA
ncbi:hypothetical protein [Pantoea eucrina]|uniref:hypothetical protein n=1 Tax=Pantoea eucrina TaxID=472693 RepID=UPI003AFA3235